MADFAAIDAARHMLELGDTATIAEIRASYRALMRRWHPDKCSDDPEACRARAAVINAAYRTLAAYCRDYRFSFSPGAVAAQASPEESWRAQFGSDPHWSNHAGPEKKKH